MLHPRLGRAAAGTSRTFKPYDLVIATGVVVAGHQVRSTVAVYIECRHVFIGIAVGNDGVSDPGTLHASGHGIRIPVNASIRGVTVYGIFFYPNHRLQMSDALHVDQSLLDEGSRGIGVHGGVAVGCRAVLVGDGVRGGKEIISNRAEGRRIKGRGREGSGVRTNAGGVQIESKAGRYGERQAIGGPASSPDIAFAGQT